MAYNLASFAQSGGLGTQSDPDLAQALEFARKYDPSAHIETRTRQQGGGDYGASVDVPTLVYDQSKLPHPPPGMTYDYGADQLGSAHVRTSTQGRTYDPQFGWIAPLSNWRDITDKENTAQQTADTGFIGKLTGGFDQKPWMALVTAIMAGAVPAVGSALGGGFAGAAGQTALRAGVSAATGGNPLSNPLSLLSGLAPAGLGELGIPSDVISGIQKGIGGVQFGLGLNDYIQGQKQYNAPSAPSAPAPTPATTTPLAPPPVIGSKPVPDVFNAAAFGGKGGSTAQVVSDGGAPVATSFAPDAYANSDKSSQIIS